MSNIGVVGLLIAGVLLLLAIVALSCILIINFLNYRDMRKCGECLSFTVFEFFKRLWFSRGFLIVGDKSAEPAAGSD